MHQLSIIYNSFAYLFTRIRNGDAFSYARVAYTVDNYYNISLLGGREPGFFAFT